MCIKYVFITVRTVCRLVYNVKPTKTSSLQWALWCIYGRTGEDGILYRRSWGCERKAE